MDSKQILVDAKARMTARKAHSAQTLAHARRIPAVDIAEALARVLIWTDSRQRAEFAHRRLNTLHQVCPAVLGGKELL